MVQCLIASLKIQLKLWKLIASNKKSVKAERIEKVKVKTSLLIFM